MSPKNHLHTLMTNLSIWQMIKLQDHEVLATHGTNKAPRWQGPKRWPATAGLATAGPAAAVPATAEPEPQCLARNKPANDPQSGVAG